MAKLAQTGGNIMGILGMSEVERQILTNQAVIMGFLHGAFLDRISSMNEHSYAGLYSYYQMTKGMLDADMSLKEDALNRTRGGKDSKC